MRTSMPRLRRGVSVRAVGVVALLGLAGCGDGGAAEPGAQGDKTGDPPVPEFDAGAFSDKSTSIDNPWLPLAPGTQFVLEGEADRGEGLTGHRVVSTVTDMTKVINGVRTLVLLDQDFNGDELVEAEIAFFAQDDEGNVWLMGEYPEEYEEGKFEGAPSSWIAGLAAARAGIIMPADPRKGDDPFLQGFAPDVDFYDLGQVLEVGRETCVPAGCYQDVLVIDEWDPLAQPLDGHQLKYQASGVGNVRVEARGGEEQETLVLVEVRRLDPAALDEAREAARYLDTRAYEVNARYEATPPLEEMSSSS